MFHFGKPDVRQDLHEMYCAGRQLLDRASDGAWFRMETNVRHYEAAYPQSALPSRLEIDMSADPAHREVNAYYNRPALDHAPPRRFHPATWAWIWTLGIGAALAIRVCVDLYFGGPSGL